MRSAMTRLCAQASDHASRKKVARIVQPLHSDYNGSTIESEWSRALDRTSVASVLEQTIGFLNGPGGLLLEVPVLGDFARRTEALLDKAHIPG